ncbi:hypothetical protein [Acaryochloris sp. IP29b_bin.137]|uniref:hypothetical protein n=1 Tax=Acaryochloris sp. IP29b_bin.137 TaxID=2969217 RepID=UPI002637FACC|nr:hypothetical protein [Acaryochloris sp. IP29b_bin.137]
MLSVLATLCLGCQPDFNAPDIQELSQTRLTQPVIQPPYLIAGPYELNPGLRQLPIQPNDTWQKPDPAPQQPKPPPAITPQSHPEKGPQGGATVPTDVNIKVEASRVNNSPPYSPAPVPPNSPLLIISPAARPSGPALRPTDIPDTSSSIPSEDAFQGGALPSANPVYSPAARPSGPALPPTHIPTLPSSAPPPEAASQGGAAEPADQISTPSPAVRPSGPRPRLGQPRPQRLRPAQTNRPPATSSAKTAPRFRTLPSPARQQNISPASQPVLVQDTPTPVPAAVQPSSVPKDLPVQPSQINPPDRLPTEGAPIGAADDPQVSFLVLENSTTDFKLDFDEFGKENLKIEEIISFRLRNGDLVTFTTGLNTYKQNDLEPVKNIPLILGWETEQGDVSLNVAAGAEVFNRLDPQPTFKVGAKTSLFGQVLVSGEVEHGPYKFNTTTLENEISYWRFRPSVFWQIDSQTTFFGLFQAGLFNDGNQEIQSFSRLERKIGPFSVAANVFTWNFAEDLEAESGYFSPLSFLLYNAEVGWKGKIFDPLTCQFAASIGNQVVNGGKSTGRGLQAKCTASLAENVELDFGYVLTNIISSGAGASNSHIFSGQLRIDF